MSSQLTPTTDIHYPPSRTGATTRGSPSVQSNATIPAPVSWIMLATIVHPNPAGPGRGLVHVVIIPPTRLLQIRGEIRFPHQGKIKSIHALDRDHVHFLVDMGNDIEPEKLVIVRRGWAKLSPLWSLYFTLTRYFRSELQL